MLGISFQTRFHIIASIQTVPVAHDDMEPGFNRNECKNELERQRSTSNHKRGANKEIDDGNGRKNEKADDKDSEEDHGNITMECDFVLNNAKTDEEKGNKDLCDETDDEQEWYGISKL